MRCCRLESDSLKAELREAQSSARYLQTMSDAKDAELRAALDRLDALGDDVRRLRATHAVALAEGEVADQRATELLRLQEDNREMERRVRTITSSRDSAAASARELRRQLAEYKALLDGARDGELAAQQRAEEARARAEALGQRRTSAQRDRDTLAKELEEINHLKDDLAGKLARSMRVAEEASEMAKQQDQSMSRLGESVQRDTQRNAM